MKIINSTGIATDTVVLDNNNNQIKGVTRINFLPIEVGGKVSAELEFGFINCDLNDVEPYVDLDTLELLAEQHGKKLI